MNVIYGVYSLTFREDISQELQKPCVIRSQKFVHTVERLTLKNIDFLNAHISYKLDLDIPMPYSGSKILSIIGFGCPYRGTM